ncbi:MAG TPA: hypothetical protein VL359_06095 [bacterium]|nr:hypothetical protein [bacterium]
MTYRGLGRSGIQVSTVGLGCMSLGTEKTRAERIIRGAFDLGVTSSSDIDA